MPDLIHRIGDARGCGATTKLPEDDTRKVYVEGHLIALAGDENTHLDGQLVSSQVTNVYVGAKKPIVEGDLALVDLLFHLPSDTKPTGFCDKTYIG